MYKFYKFYIKNNKFYNMFYDSSTSSTIIRTVATAAAVATTTANLASQKGVRLHTPIRVVMQLTRVTPRCATTPCRAYQKRNHVATPQHVPIVRVRVSMYSLNIITSTLNRSCQHDAHTYSLHIRIL